METQISCCNYNWNKGCLFAEACSKLSTEISNTLKEINVEGQKVKKRGRKNKTEKETSSMVQDPS
jgi:hypothetical protein